MPWCVRKCPYCDFNSHAVPDGALSAELEQTYLKALVADFETQVEMAQGRSIHSVFIGGGTPSLISAKGYAWLFEQLKSLLNFEDDCEITLEANPGTLEHDPFAGYLEAGINRLSIGVQTFNTDHLQKLGRIHSANNAMDAIEQARQAGFKRVNVDLMHGLPEQTLEQALYDLKTAVEQGATHISWYQLTIEPNTVFFRTQHSRISGPLRSPRACARPREHPRGRRRPGLRGRGHARDLHGRRRPGPAGGGTGLQLGRRDLGGLDPRGQHGHP